MTAHVKLDGTWLRSVGDVQSVKWSSQWGSVPCGPLLASWTLDVSPVSDSPVLSIGRAASITDGVRVFGGETTEPQRGYPWSFSANGYARRAGDFLAISSSGAPTTNPREAVTEAIANGLPWSNPTAFPNSALGDTPVVPQSLDALLNNWAITSGNRWGVDAYGVAFIATDPTTPDWYLDASDLPIGVADDGLYNWVHATYVSSVDGGGTPIGWGYEDAVETVAFGTRQYEMDLTPLGLMSGATALAYAQQQLALMTVPQWLNRITTDASRLRTVGYHPAHLPSVRAGQMVRLYNVPRNLGNLRGQLAMDVVLGEVEYDTTEPTKITLAPVNLAVRNLADALAQAAAAAKKVGGVGVFA